MFKSALIGLWICVMTAGALYISKQGLPDLDAEVDEAGEATTERTKMSVVAVAIFEKGDVTGYFTSRPFLFVDPQKAAVVTAPLEALVRDGLHKIVYHASETDFTETASLDVAAIEAKLKAAVNDRLGEPVIHDITLTDVSYLERE